MKRPTVCVYPLVGGTRQRHSDGKYPTEAAPENTLKPARLPRWVHAVLGSFMALRLMLVLLKA